MRYISLATKATWGVSALFSWIKLLFPPYAYDQKGITTY
jgi:hypothetical protein